MAGHLKKKKKKDKRRRSRTRSISKKTFHEETLLEAHESSSDTFFLPGEDPDANLPGHESFRSLGTTGRDEPGFRADRNRAVAFHQWATNPMAKRMISIGSDHIVGEGISITSKNEKSRAVLKKFWKDPVNMWPLFQYEFADQLSIFGDQLLPVMVNEATGQVRLGYIDPSQINTVILDPMNGKRVVAVLLKSSHGHPEVTLTTIMVNEDPKTENAETLGLRMGQAFYFRINGVTNARRGTSDLHAASDYLDGRDRMIFMRIDRQQLMLGFVWDVEIQDANEDAIKKWLKRTKPPRSGSIRAHNQKVKWTAVVPDMKASDASKDLDILKADILTSLGYPWHWFGSGEGVNKATAVEMGSPTHRALLRRQAILKFFLSEIIEFVLDQALLAGTISLADREEGFDIMMPQFATRDLATASTTALNTTNTLILGEANNYISEETARKVYLHMISMLGIKIDPEEEAKLINNQNQGAVETENAEMVKLLDDVERALGPKPDNQPIEAPKALPLTAGGSS